VKMRARISRLRAVVLESWGEMVAIVQDRDNRVTEGLESLHPEPQGALAEGLNRATRGPVSSHGGPKDGTTGQYRFRASPGRYARDKKGYCCLICGHRTDHGKAMRMHFARKHPLIPSRQK